MKIIRTLAAILALAITCSATAQTITPPTRRAKTPTIEYHQPDLKPGYRGFANFAWVMGVGEWAVDRVEFATVHGYQICPNLFVGAGVSLDYYCSGCASSSNIVLTHNSQSLNFVKQAESEVNNCYLCV